MINNAFIKTVCVLKTSILQESKSISLAVFVHFRFDIIFSIAILF